jgi:hypothetical protein
MSNKQFLPLAIGQDAFSLLRKGNCYYVDKTPFLKQVFAVDPSEVLIFTRPRRFGKTLLISMFDSFLKINPEKPFDNSKQQELFKGTKILEDKEFCDKFMGQCPVIAVSFKDVEGNTFEEAYKMIADIVLEVSKRYEYLLDSNKLDESDKVILRQLTDVNYLEDINNSQRVKNSLKHLASFLYKEYGRQPILLIDEYDVPLAKASYHDLDDKRSHKSDPDYEPTFHKRMVTLMSGIFGVLKNNVGNESPISKTVITGCLKVAKNSIFTGVNNLNVNTVTSQNMNLTGIIGFTKEDTYQILKNYEMDDYATDVKNNYDGYKFCDKEMFCPWDVIKYLDENYQNNLNGYKNLVKANNYWANSTSSPALYEYLGFLTDNDNQKMQDLVDGKSISFKLNESMNYDTLSEHKSNDFWSLLLHTGYLTVDWELTQKGELAKENNKDIFARIPNLEILECFTKNIKDRFNNKIAPNSVADALATNLFEGKTEIASDTIFNLLQSYISIRDNATKAPHENYYHGYLNGLFSNCSINFFSEYHSNYESGDGYADIVFKSKREDKVVIIEIKTCTVSESKKAKARVALAQIEDKNYAQPYLENEDISSIYAYGIAFSGKSCSILEKKLK